LAFLLADYPGSSGPSGVLNPGLPALGSEHGARDKKLNDESENRRSH